jgi:hypothetical protein
MTAANMKFMRTTDCACLDCKTNIYIIKELDIQPFIGSFECMVRNPSIAYTVAYHKIWHVYPTTDF